jgi:hypothetical protein
VPQRWDRRTHVHRYAEYTLSGCLPTLLDFIVRFSQITCARDARTWLVSAPRHIQPAGSSQVCLGRQNRSKQGDLHPALYDSMIQTNIPSVTSVTSTGWSPPAHVATLGTDRSAWHGTVSRFLRYPGRAAAGPALKSAPWVLVWLGPCGGQPAHWGQKPKASPGSTWQASAPTRQRPPSSMFKILPRSINLSRAHSSFGSSGCAESRPIIP